MAWLAQPHWPSRGIALRRLENGKFHDDLEMDCDSSRPSQRSSANEKTFELFNSKVFISRSVDSRPLFLLLAGFFLLLGRSVFFLFGWSIFFLLSRSVAFLLLACGSSGVTSRSNGATFHLGLVISCHGTSAWWNRGWFRGGAFATTSDCQRHQATSQQHCQLFHYSFPCCLNCSEGRLADDLRWIHLVASGR